MKKFNLAVIAGDGIGPEVVNEGLKVLEAVSGKYDLIFEKTFYELGAAYWHKTGETLPDSVMSELAKADVTIDLPTLLGLSNNPGQIEGLGPIPASIARKLAADGKWRKFITDPLSGNLLDMGRTHYVPSQYLVDFLTARDRICRFPGCSQPARLGDIDHAKSWDEGGETNRQNLGFLCRRHHRLKTHGNWKLTSNEDGSCTWVSPLGKEFFVPSRPLNEST